MKELIQKIDVLAISRFRAWELPLARIALCIVYVWFGVIKFIGASPATPLVQTLFDETLAFLLPFSLFYAAFSLFEVAIGFLFLVRGLERIALLFLGFHLFTTALPLLMLPDVAWQSFLVPTLEGQYIIKNILIVAAAVVIGSKLTPLASAQKD